MKDVARFLVAALLLLPCVLIFNNSDSIWLNVIGVVYFFCFVACVLGEAKKLDAWLKKIEEFEENLMDVK